MHDSGDRVRVRVLNIAKRLQTCSCLHVHNHPMPLFGCPKSERSDHNHRTETDFRRNFQTFLLLFGVIIASCGAFGLLCFMCFNSEKQIVIMWKFRILDNRKTQSNRNGRKFPIR